MLQLFQVAFVILQLHSVNIFTEDKGRIFTKGKTGLFMEKLLGSWFMWPFRSSVSNKTLPRLNAEVVHFNFSCSFDDNKNILVECY